MNFRTFSLIAFILFTLGLGGIFLTDQILQLRPLSVTRPSDIRNQPHVIPGWGTYTDKLNSFTVQYPSTDPAPTPDIQTHNTVIERLVHLSTASTTVIGGLTISQSNDSVIGVNIYISPDRSHCLTFATPSSTISIINGVPFKITAHSDAAMGGERGLIREYHTLRNSTCYMLESIVHYRDIAFLSGVTGAQPHAASPTDIKQQADWIEQQQQLQSQIVGTFSFSQ